MLESLLVSIHVISLFNETITVTLYRFSFSVPELPELVNELQDVSDWIPFGLYLGIKMPKLESVKVDCQTIAECRIQMLSEWQKNVTPTWSAVVQVLLAIQMRHLASHLAQKHGW